MKIEDLIRLVEALESSTFDEFNLELQDMKMSLRRGGRVDYVQTAPAPVVPVPAAPAAASALPVDPPDQPAKETGLVEVIAPMVGTYYQSGAPDAEPFVTPGTLVSSGDTLCILEAMKLMNEIQAETEGEVVQVFAVNGELVEYGQVLMTIRPARS